MGIGEEETYKEVRLRERKTENKSEKQIGRNGPIVEPESKGGQDK